MQTQQISKKVQRMENEIINALINTCSIPALSPTNGREGEWKKALFLKELISPIFDAVEIFSAKDERVKNGRPNIIAKVNANAKETIWIVSHMDVVPIGDEKKWNSNPFSPIIKDGKIYGRGVEDNGQSLIASIFAVKVLKELGIKPKKNIGIAIVSDEEEGSEFGIKFLLTQNIFKKGDLIIVPDFGNEKGDKIEIAEKSLLWIKIKTEGIQCHGSMPEVGINAMKVASEFINETKQLYKKFNKKDKLFCPNISTFEATKKEKNVDAINIIPGEDIFYMDCRILPNYKIQDVIKELEKIADKVVKRNKKKIKGKMQFPKIEIIKERVEESAPSTSEKSKVVQLLSKAIKEVKGVSPTTIGIGGGTCAKFFRDNGYEVAVWSTIEENAHQVNENIKIENLINDTKVFAVMMGE